MGSITIKLFDDSHILTNEKCTNEYGEILYEIKAIIAEFEGKKLTYFNDEWKEIITYIEKGNEKLKECYTQRLLQLKLDDDNDIKKFYTKCKSNTECLSYISPKLEKAVELKGGTEISCKKGQGCAEKVKAVKGKESGRTSQVNEKDSRTKDLETPKSQGLGETPVGGKEPRIQQVIPRVQQDVRSRGTSVKTHLEEPEVKDNHHSNPPAAIDNETPFLGVSTVPSNMALGSNPSDSSAQSGSERESSSVGTSQEKTSQTVAAQRDALNSQTPNDKAHGTHIVGSQTGEDDSMVPTTEKPAEGTSASGELGDEDSHHTDDDRVGNGRTSAPPVDAAKVEGSSVASGDTLHVVNGINHGATAREDVVTKAVDGVPVDNERSGSGVSAVVSDLTKVENHGRHDDASRALARETPRNAESSEITRGEGTACKKLGGQLCTDSSITKADYPTQSSLSTSYTNAAGEGSLNAEAGLTIRNNQDSTDADSTKLQGREFSQSKSVAQQKSIDEAGVVKAEKNHERLQDQGKNVATSPGLQVAIQEFSEAGVPNRANISGEPLVNSQENLSGAGATGEAVATWSDNVLNMFNMLFSNDQYKEYIMMALVPLAIILLLTFLIKFTPLGTLFTKKKKKKQKKMNEKLQRVLSEYPAQMNERNIPFSYSPFAYSTQ